MFAMDEWDAVFYKDFISENNKRDYLAFLRDLLKGQGYVELAYMTGILPIAKYSSGSEIDMFKEYDMTTSEKYNEYFGFSDVEVDWLFGREIEILKIRLIICVKFLSNIFNFTSYYDNIKQIIVFCYIGGCLEQAINIF